MRTRPQKRSTKATLNYDPKYRTFGTLQRLPQ
jgi:hypothetical protein